MGYKKLLEYEEQGYVFHGSKYKDIEVLKPKKANDAGDDLWNKDIAVYASLEPVYAVIFSLTKEYVGSFSVNLDCGRVIATFDKDYFKQLSTNSGYVYVLNSKDFININGFQCKSKKEVVPVDCIKVSLDDYLNLGGIVEFK